MPLSHIQRHVKMFYFPNRRRTSPKKQRSVKKKEKKARQHTVFWFMSHPASSINTAAPWKTSSSIQ